MGHEVSIVMNVCIVNAFPILAYVGQCSAQEQSEDRLMNGQLLCKASWQDFFFLPLHSFKPLAMFS